MDIQNLQTFLAVAKLGSFTKAAEQNFISPTAVMKQINKLINVIKIVNLTHIDSINRELVMIKVKADPITRNDIVNIVNIFRAKIVDINRETLVIELTGDHTKIDALCEMLADYEVIEVARTGTLTMSRGTIPVKNM